MKAVRIEVFFLAISWCLLFLAYLHFFLSIRPPNSKDHSEEKDFLDKRLSFSTSVCVSILSFITYFQLHSANILKKYLNSTHHSYG